MISILVSGLGGRMGRALTNYVSNSKTCKVVCGVDRYDPMFEGVFCFATFDEVTIKADVVIDFSNADNIANVINFSVKNKLPCIICTTGIDEKGVALINKAAQSIPVFYSANMSLGINLLLELARKAALILGESYDIEIIEKHHNQKVDAPSGTALMIADEINNALDEKFSYVFERHSKKAKRTSSEIGIHSVRGGTIVGEHDIIFAGLADVFTISHSAQSREVFAQGAVAAANFIVRKPKGLYTMKDVISGQFA